MLCCAAAATAAMITGDGHINHGITRITAQRTALCHFSQFVTISVRLLHLLQSIKGDASKVVSPSSERRKLSLCHVS